MKIPYISLLAAAFIIACGDGDSDSFLVRGDSDSYSGEEEDLSSSSELSSSSSERRSSSSLIDWLDTIPHIPPCRDDYEDNCKYGTLVDERDGQEYKTVYIGEQIWMAENLKYVSENSECYNDILEKCDVYGRLYPWADAMDACPSGWHLPSLDEWKILYTYAGGIKTSASKLRATDVWTCSGCKGSDAYGFSVLPAGAYRDMHSAFWDINATGYFWTSTDYDSGGEYVYNMCFDYRDELIDGRSLKTENTFSVRCIRD